MRWSPNFNHGNSENNEKNSERGSKSMLLLIQYEKGECANAYD